VNLNKEFNLMFNGEVARQYNANDVRKKLSVIFKIPDEKLDKLFSGSPFVIKKNVTKADALLLQQKLFAVGAVTYLEPVGLESLNAAVQLHKTGTTHMPITNPAVNNNLASALAPSSVLNLAPVASQVFNCPAPVSEPEFDDDVEGAPRGYGITAAQVVPLCMVILAAVLLIAYFPFPSMSLKKGFAIGGLLMFFGIRKLRH
jgi:hypothetical protein